MQRTPVSSSNLSSVGYDARSATLEIAFNGGGVYEYNRVPESVYNGLMAASSKGRYFDSMIKDAYSYRKIS